MCLGPVKELINKVKEREYTYQLPDENLKTLDNQEGLNTRYHYLQSIVRRPDHSATTL